MTAIMTTTTRVWESEDSAESINNRFRVGSGPQTANLNSRNESSKLNSSRNGPKKSSKIFSRTNLLASPKRKINDNRNSGLELNGVKKSALLYEITERTKRLAMPKATITVSGTQEKKEKVPPRTISLPKILSERVAELSRPKSIYDPPTKPLGYIAPSALRAVATQRILELATPRKTKSPRSQTKKNLFAVLNAPCSSRISYLARPKYVANCSRAQKNFLKRSTPAENYPLPWEFPSTRVWKELGYSEKIVKKCGREYCRRGKPGRNRKLIKLSQSNDSVFSLSVPTSNVKSSGKHKRRKFHSEINRRKRSKNYQITF